MARLLFTDQASWTDEQIVAAYQGQAHIERAIRQMKDPHLVNWRPMSHWTDGKVRVHAFDCVMALGLSSLLLREVHRRAQARGMEPPVDSIPELLGTLGAIYEAAHLYPPASKMPGRLALSEMTPSAHRAHITRKVTLVSRSGWDTSSASMLLTHSAFAS